MLNCKFGSDIPVCFFTWWAGKEIKTKTARQRERPTEAREGWIKLWLVEADGICSISPTILGAPEGKPPLRGEDTGMIGYVLAMLADTVRMEIREMKSQSWEKLRDMTDDWDEALSAPLWWAAFCRHPLYCWSIWSINGSSHIYSGWGRAQFFTAEPTKHKQISFE